MLRIVLICLCLAACLPKKSHEQNPTTQTTPQTQTSASVDATEPSESQGTPIPFDTSVRKGVLKNGLTYYIKVNNEPENRAELRLAVNAGSILEEDHQQGLAHLLEHLAFEGTKNFEKKEIVNYLESIGLQFGPDLNAYTSFDETVYMLKVPTDEPEFMHKGMQILRDWASDILLEKSALEAERGVVIEERRLRLGATQRIRNQQYPLLFKGSRYAERLPIGTVEVLETAPRKALLSFYEDWYRPDLMAVVVVGDVDADQMETRIKSLFSDLKNPKKPRKREEYTLPDHEETLFSIVKDPEQTQSLIEIVYKHPLPPQGTEESYRQSLVEGLYHMMLNDRLAELTKKADPPFIVAYSDEGAFSRAKSFYNQIALVRGSQYLRALEALMTEAERVKRFGFTETELDRAKTNLLRSYERSYEERDKRNSASYAAEFLRNYFTNESVPGMEKEYEYAKSWVPAISLDEVNDLANKWITHNNRVIMVTGPEQAKTPTKEELLSTIEKVAAKELEPYQDDRLDAPLIENEPQPGSVVSKQMLNRVEAHDWKLSNGVRVILKPTDFKNDEILMRSFSPGGSSLVSIEDYVPAMTATLLVEASGLGAFNNTQLQKKLTGKVVNVSPYISSQDEGINASASVADVETLFQLTHLYFTAPRVDEKGFTSTITRWKALLANRDKTPNAVFSDAIQTKLYNNHPRRQPFTQETLQKMDMQKSLEIYRDRFADASDFTFVFVGSFQPEQLEPLIVKYLASLPSLEREEKGVDNGIEFAEGVTEVIVTKGLEEKSSVRLMFHGDAEWSLENIQIMQVMTGVLRIRLREVLREEMSGVYGVRVSGNLNKRPKETYTLSISFGCAPENVEPLIQGVKTAIASIAAEGLDESYMVKVRAQQKREREQGLRQNGFWMVRLAAYLRNDVGFDFMMDYSEHIDQRSMEEVKAAVAKYANWDSMLKAVLYPQEETASN